MRRLLLALTILISLRNIYAFGRRKAPRKDLTEDEKLETFWPAFATFDRNKNARISADEISYAMKNGDLLKDEDVQYMIQTMGLADMDGNTELSFPEFAKMMVQAAEEEL